MRYHHQPKYFRQSKADSRRLRGERKQLQRTRRHDQQTTTAEKSGEGWNTVTSCSHLRANIDNGKVYYTGIKAGDCNLGLKKPPGLPKKLYICAHWITLHWDEAGTFIPQYYELASTASYSSPGSHGQNITAVVSQEDDPTNEIPACEALTTWLLTQVSSATPEWRDNGIDIGVILAIGLAFIALGGGIVMRRRRQKTKHKCLHNHRTAAQSDHSQATLLREPEISLADAFGVNISMGTRSETDSSSLSAVLFGPSNTPGDIELTSVFLSGKGSDASDTPAPPLPMSAFGRCDLEEVKSAGRYDSLSP